MLTNSKTRSPTKGPDPIFSELIYRYSLSSTGKNTTILIHLRARFHNVGSKTILADTVILSVEEHVAEIRFNRPNVLNAPNIEVAEEFEAAVNSVLTRVNS